MNGTILHNIRRYCERQDITESKFGRLAANDPALVRTMRAGRALRPATLQKVRAFLQVPA